MSKSEITPAAGFGSVVQTGPMSWTVQLEEDPDTGELIMPIPDELLAAQGWEIGDTLEWDVNEANQELSLKKV